MCILYIQKKLLLTSNVYQVASNCLDSSLLKYSAKEYFFRASLCHLSVDVLNAQLAVEKYSQQYPAYQDSREFKLVKVCTYYYLFVCVTLCVFFFIRLSLIIWRSRTSMASPKRSRSTTAFLASTNGTPQSCCELRRLPTTTPTFDKHSYSNIFSLLLITELNTHTHTKKHIQAPLLTI